MANNPLRARHAGRQPRAGATKESRPAPVAHHRSRTPGGAEAVDTFELGTGDMYFIPKAYPHHIENIGENIGFGADAPKLHFLVFFDQAMGQDIGYTGGIPAFPRRIVAPTLGTTVAALPAYPEVPADLMIVRALKAQ